jgi:hypothetical protein
MKKCGSCGKLKEFGEFSWRNKSENTLQSACKECARAYARQNYLDRPEYYKAKAKTTNVVVHARNKAWIRQYLLTHPCACGESDIEVLQFDHDVPLNDWKAKRVGHFMKGSLSRLQEQVARCTVRCANCHYRMTRKQMGWSWD